MRELIVIGLLAFFTALSPMVALGASDTAVLTADLQVVDTVNVTGFWLTTFIESKDFGATGTGLTLSDTIQLDVIHNMGATQTFSLGATVERIGGPTWETTISMNDGSEYLIWDETDFGTTYTFTDAIGGTTAQFTKNVMAFFNVEYTQQASDAYQFRLTFTVTSL